MDSKYNTNNLLNSRGDDKMSYFKNIFSEVYDIALSEAHSLFVAMDKENISAVMLDGHTYWTETPSVYSEGLTKKQHKQLAEIMNKHYQAKYLYEVGE